MINQHFIGLSTNTDEVDRLKSSTLLGTVFVCLSRYNAFGTLRLRIFASQSPVRRQFPNNLTLTAFCSAPHIPLSNGSSVQAAENQNTPPMEMRGAWSEGCLAEADTEPTHAFSIQHEVAFSVKDFLNKWKIVSERLEYVMCAVSTIAEVSSFPFFVSQL